MTENRHSQSREKVCICGKKADRIISDAEIQKLNGGSEPEKQIDFNKESIPIGICKKCVLSIRTKKSAKVGLWEEHRPGVNY